MIKGCVKDFEMYLINAILLITAFMAYTNYYNISKIIIIFLIIFNIVMFLLSYKKFFSCNISLEEE